jgi:hypothetical protein
MKRPYFVHFLPVKTHAFLRIRASISKKDYRHNIFSFHDDATSQRPPIEALRLLNAYEFSIKVIALSDTKEEVFRKTYSSDSFGNFDISIGLNEKRRQISILKVYEVATDPGIEYFLGSYIPLQIDEPKKIIICDFDKTLLDTRFSTTRDLYESLTTPLFHFPKVEESLSILKSYIAAGYHPFIVSASPHFYEESMRNWLYQNQIFTAGIFLKDYREVFSISSGTLSAKDLKVQGMYKLSHLFDIVSMTGLPNELVLMGDNYESDPIIYLTLILVIQNNLDPRSIWNLAKKHKAFTLTSKQNSYFLNRIYELSNLISRDNQRRSLKSTQCKIYIRKKSHDDELNIPEDYHSMKNLITLYNVHLNPPTLSQNSKEINSVEGSEQKE